MASSTGHCKECSSCPFRLNLLNISTSLDAYCEKGEGIQLAPKPPSLITAKLIQLQGLSPEASEPPAQSRSYPFFSFCLTPFSLCVLPVGTLSFFPSVRLSYVSGVIRCLIIDNSSRGGGVGGRPSVSQLAGGPFNLLSSLRTGLSEWCFS